MEVVDTVAEAAAVEEGGEMKMERERTTSSRMHLNPSKKLHQHQQMTARHQSKKFPPPPMQHPCSVSL